MTVLFGRTASVTIGSRGQGRKVTDLRIVFKVEKTIKRGPNKGVITLYNVNDTTAELSQEDDAVVVLEAGYGGNNRVLYVGDIKRVVDDKKRPDRLLRMECVTEGNRAYAKRITKSFERGTATQVVVNELVQALGIPAGEVVDQLQGQFAAGFVASGVVADVLEDVTKRLGLEWFINDFDVVVIQPDQALDQTAIIVNPDTGLVGSIKRTKDGFDYRTLLIPELVPGMPVFASNVVEGSGFATKAKRVLYTGDTRGSAWYCDVQAIQL